MRRLLLVALLATAALLAGCAGTPERPATQVAVDDEVPAATSMNEADIRFLRVMAAHTEQSVEIARSVQDRIDDPEIKILVGAVKATEFDEHVMTRAWLQAVDSDPAATASPEDIGQAAIDGGLDRLRDTPDAAVDAVLCELLGTHHRTAAELARSHAEAGTSPEVLAYARRVEQSRAAGADILDRLSSGDA
ncbi:DUF305 domain-containing protein [Salinispora tropica]|uniref:DUF305 domain-containing protein n=1 Tax=Salinispora tropica (strain ATCC BAA-916 / DSM 44818 / JCM 13857 / NBRC 105044 / CNB-440) TaxID=369723 RepID=A4X5G3_SALTO|nr:DUF305 domain-containing protein [Salinispora tropica]ABP54113.1 hypothetical protein Strop_1648 [Salinispora tropica CNB-440]